MLTLSEIKREIRALQRKYHKEIAIYRLRRASDEIYNDYARAVGDRQDPPKPLEIIRKIARPGFPPHHLDSPAQLPGQGQGEWRHTRTPGAWSWPCCPGPGRANTTTT